MNITSHTQLFVRSDYPRCIISVDDKFKTVNRIAAQTAKEALGKMQRFTKRATVYMHGKLAGHLERAGRKVYFQYEADYLENGLPLSLSLPLRAERFESDGLPAYFSGLCSEGWLRRIQSFEQKIDPNDRFTLLINNGLDLAGAVTIQPTE